MLALAAAAGPAAAACKLTKVAELPVTIERSQALIAATINGSDTRLIVDSGAWWSVLTPASAAQFKLRLRPPPYGLVLEGVGGTADMSATTIDHFSLTNIPIRHIDFLVGGTDIGGGAAGVLGQNVLEGYDVEYDLAHGMIRMFRPEGCRAAVLTYWSGPQQPYSGMDINWATIQEPHTIGAGFVNGARIRVTFDTGSGVSMLSRAAAARAGIRSDGPGVVDGGVTYGIGRREEKTWIAPVASFKIGEEEIRNTKLRFGDLVANWDMLLGMDFFLSHRIYVANSQKKLYFTYNGGPVFNLASTTRQVEPALPPAGPTAETPAAADIGSEEPTDAAGFSRRGMAFAARHDLAHAIADLTRACELAPTEPEYFYQRSLAYRENRQAVLAMADLDETLKRNPEHLDALVARVAPKEAQVRLRIGELFTVAGLFPAAVEQFDLWLPSHEEDAQRSEGLAERCWAGALGRQELDKALDDCTAALRLNSAAVLGFNGRGLVWLRFGDLDKSISDYDQALKLPPRNAWALYGRGVDKSRKGLASEAQADFKAATALHPLIAEQARTVGIAP
jgi:tetratricopeptide (TPR) repeat protein